MDATYIQKGELIDYTPSADVDAGDVVVQGDIVGVANLDIAANKLGALAITGTFDFAKASGDGGITAGALCYWDVAEAVAKGDAEAGANKLIGKAIKAAGNLDVLVRISLCSGDAVTVTAAEAAVVAAAAAATAAAMPPGGTGAAAGGWDTALHRDAAIAEFAALLVDVADIRTQLNAALAALKAAGLMASA